MNKALLLIGPTGSGKSPLGEILEVKGLQGRRCLHFDFGENLRSAATSAPGDLLTEGEIVFVCEVLQSGVLLENEHFHIAEKILQYFLAGRKAGSDDLVILNGLPRHVGQAKDVDNILKIETVVDLVCSPEVVLERVRKNVGADRDGRLDDDLQAVRNKLAIFAARTAPLVDHYQFCNCVIKTIPIGVKTTAEDALQALNTCLA